MSKTKRVYAYALLNSDVFCAFVFLIPIAIMYIMTMVMTQCHFTYSMDDPYIHLELAKNILAGHYGINMIEPCAPDSSIIWPFILSPFAAFPSIFEYIPLIINTICVVLSGLVLIRIFSEMKKGVALWVSVTIMFALNIFGVAFGGMEHNLQILLVLCIVWALLNLDRFLVVSHLRVLLYASLYLLPLVRYEGLAVSMPVLFYLFIKGDKKYASIVFVAIIISVGSFSYFLFSQGLGLLPASVVLKSAHGGLETVICNILNNGHAYFGLFLIVFIYGISKYKSDKFFVIMIFATTALHITFGKNGWVGRYEVYYLAFVIPFILKSIYNKWSNLYSVLVIIPIILLCANARLVMTTINTPLGCANIYNQQAQTAKIAGYLNSNVAVNDLGLVCLRTDCYVLDLAGLASLEALHNRLKSHTETQWITDLMVKYDVKYAMIYDECYPNKPSNWTCVGRLQLLQRRITPAYSQVSFYATTPESVDLLKQALTYFSANNKSTDFEVVME